jgi:hypothetical protein
MLVQKRLQDMHRGKQLQWEYRHKIGVLHHNIFIWIIWNVLSAIFFNVQSWAMYKKIKRWKKKEKECEFD